MGKSFSIYLLVNLEEFMKNLLVFAALSFSGLTSAREPVVVNPQNYEWSSDKQFTFEKQKANDRAKRKIASNIELTDDLMSKEYKNFREKFLSIKTPEELDKQLVEMDANYNSYPADLKFIVALLTPLHSLRAFTYKMYPLITKEKISHSVILSNVLRFASMMSVNLPTSQWMAGFKYTSEPFTAEDDVVRFQTTEDFQDFVGKTLYPELLKAAVRIKALNFSDDKIIWDNKLFYGTASFQDGFKRYNTIGESERLATLASLHTALAGAARFQAYNVQEFIAFTKELAGLYGYDSLFSEVDGVTAKKIHDVMIKAKYKNLFTLRANGVQNMIIAYKHLKEASRLGVISWQEVRDRSANDSDLFNPNYFDGSASRIDKNAENIEKMMSGKNSFRSDITGEVLTVDFPSFYTNPPTDLKALFPISFEGGEKHLSKTVKLENGKTKILKYRNYFYGRSIGWDLKAYHLVFPDLKSGEDVSKAIRILNQSAGSFPAADNFNFFMSY
jgi:hypothetical protein